MEELTKRQEEVLRKIYDFIKKNGYPPTIIELSEILDVNIKTCYGFLLRLQNKGYIGRKDGASRSIILTEEAIEILKKKKIPVLGRIVAGTPVFSEVDIEGELVVDRTKFPKDNYFALKVRGDSMIEAGIYEGDYIIVEPVNNGINGVVEGDIVVAMVDGEVTLKRLYIKRDEGICILHPENKNLKDIIVRGKDLEIVGKVVGLQRFY
ncbi:MAG: transcriptional repressor LexA [Spirochaetes bacterium]|nr:transcriptional repressor LexA [Spirochaetota bacterium]